MPNVAVLYVIAVPEPTVLFPTTTSGKLIADLIEQFFGIRQVLQRNVNFTV
jgi:hypothetical protein